MEEMIASFLSVETLHEPSYLVERQLKMFEWDEDKVRHSLKKEITSQA